MILATLLGCLEEPPPPAPAMTDMLRPVLVLNTGSTSPGGPEKVTAFLHPEQVGGCHKFQATAKIDGVEMPRLHGKVTGSFTYDRDCDVYEFALEPATGVGVGPTSTLEVTDGVSTARMVVDAPFAPRTLTPEKPEVKAGDEVVLRWSPATDAYDGKGDIGVSLAPEGGQPVVVRKDQVRFADGAVRFALPADLPKGPVKVEFLGTAFVQPRVARCDWVVSCTVSRLYTVEPTTLVVGR